MHILGLSAFYHDSAAAVIVDGKIVAAAQEERFTRRKHDQRFPARALAYCLAEAGLKLEDIDYVAFYDKPFLKFERLLETYVAFAPRGLRSFQRAMPIWIKEKLFQKDLLRAELEQIAPAVDWRSRLLFAEHHISHAASAYIPRHLMRRLCSPLTELGNGARPQPASAAAISSASSASCIFRIRSACFIPRSPTTPDLRSTRASTR
jgi:predicted NodU family carbamoyl transferase